MKLSQIQFSSVVAGKAHNPTILNPDFLAVEGIVPKSWNWTVAETITTPPFAMVRYENGITISVEQTKLQVLDPNVEDGPEKSKVTEIASSYVNTLRHVHYMSVGNNFQSILKVKSRDVLKTLFLKKGSWDTPDRKLDAVGIRLIYPLNPGKLTLSLDIGEAILPDKADKQPVIIADANFNRECRDHPAYEEVSNLLEKSEEDWVIYQNLLKDFITG